MHNSWRRNWLLLGSALTIAVMAPAPAAAQVDARLDRIESQLRALQRAVFPGGDERYFEPEITPDGTSTSGTPGISGSTLTAVLARLDAIEAQLSRLTAATEVNENALVSLEMRVAALEARGVAVQPGSQPVSPPNDQPTGAIAVPADSAPVATTPTPPRPSAARLEGVQSIAKPATGDAGDDEYVYGFRLWDAGYYPEAQQQLALFVDRYPDHWRTTYGRNLLGRAFLDAGDPRAAATHFFENYQSDKTADRAADSLLYLAQSMIELGDTRRACIALAEFGETYPALAVGRLQSMYEGLRGRVSCDG